MKKLLILPVAVLMVSCCTSQKATTFAKADVTQLDCPDKGECTVELMKNKSLNIRTDEFGGTYYQLLESTNKHVIVFHYTKGREETMPDSGYREELIVEIDAANPEINISGKELQNAKVLFGRFCFCPKGTTGYFKILEGDLKVAKLKEKLVLTANFKIEEVPQIVNKIEITVQ